jgi:hypothetical protein
MSLEREVIDLDDNITRKLSAGDSLTPEEFKHLKARRLEVLGRSYVNANLHVNTPNHMHGEWVPNDPVEIHRKESLGYKLADSSEYKLSLNPGHSDGTGKLQVGDVVYMVTPKVNQQIIEQIRAEEFQEMHGTKGGKQREERDFTSSFQQNISAEHGKPEILSRTHSVDGTEIKSTLTSGT